MKSNDRKTNMIMILNKIKNMTPSFITQNGSSFSKQETRKVVFGRLNKSSDNIKGEQKEQYFPHTLDKSRGKKQLHTPDYFSSHRTSRQFEIRPSKIFKTMTPQQNFPTPKAQPILKISQIVKIPRASRTNQTPATKTVICVRNV